MRWVNFPDGSSYTFAVDIQKFAELNGYTAPCEEDGTRHPGTDCNQKMRTVMKVAGMRMTFRITEQSVVDIRVEDSYFNASVVRSMVDCGLASNTHLRMGAIQLYTLEAVNAILSVMLKTHVEYQPDDTDEAIHFATLPKKRAHNFEKRKNKPRASLFMK